MPDLHGARHVGVEAVRLMVEEELGWLFREQPAPDYGVDAYLEVVHENERLTGQLVAVQIKSGQSYFRDLTEDSWVFHLDHQEVEHWRTYALPVVVILYNDETKTAYWQAATPDFVTSAGKAHVLFVPEDQRLDRHARQALRVYARLHRSTGQRANNQPVNNVESARARVRSQDLQSFIGVHECSWLDAKGAPYRLDDAVSAAELLKDVAAMANARGGLLLVGFATRLDAGREIIDELRAVPSHMVDLDRCRKVLRRGVHPYVRGLDLHWIPVEDGKGVLVIDVPEQAEADKPFVVPGPSGDKVPNIGVPVRDGDGTHWLPRPELQRLLAAGWNATGGPSEAIMSAFESTLTSALTAPPEPVPPPTRVGEGAGDMQGAFQVADVAAGSLQALGAPREKAHWLDIGYVQTINGGPSSDAVVICALPDHAAVVVPMPIWKALSRIGQGVADVGFPVRPRGDHQPLVVDASAPSVDLDGGAWGAGRLVYAPSADRWLWQPAPKLDFTLWHNHHWYRSAGTDLLVRAVAYLPWLNPDGEPEITRAGRQRLQAALATAEIANAIPALSTHRGVTVEGPAWLRATGPDSYQSDRSTHFRAVLASPDGTAALASEVLLQLPDGMRSTAVLGCAELRVNFDAWRAVLAAGGADLPADADWRLSITEIIDVLQSAWGTATCVAPLAAVDDPLQMPPAAPPYVELHLQATPPVTTDTRRHLGLPDVVDLSPFGEPSQETYRQETGMRVIAPLDIDGAARRRLIAEGLARLARSWGHIDAEADELLGFDSTQPS